MFGGIGGRAVGADIVYCWIVKVANDGDADELGRRLCVLGEMTCKYLARCSNVPIIQYLKWVH